MMDDATINRLAAERVLGWRKVDRYNVVYSTPEGRIVKLPDFCNDPAAWGGELLVWLARDDCDVEISSDCDPDKGGAMWLAIVSRQCVAYRAAAWNQPGRALALAALRAYGVEVDE